MDKEYIGESARLLGSVIIGVGLLWDVRGAGFLYETRVVAAGICILGLAILIFASLIDGRLHTLLRWI